MGYSKNGSLEETPLNMKWIDEIPLFDGFFPTFHNLIFCVNPDELNAKPTESHIPRRYKYTSVYINFA